MSPTTIAKGMSEIRSGVTPGEGRIRKPGGGRPALTDTDATLLKDLKALVVGDARGDPESPLLWTAKSVRMLAGALREQGHAVSHETVAKLLRGLGYSLQANRKTLEGASHPDRDAQFAHINATVAAAQTAGQPTISVDTKKKELVGDFKNAGREWRPKASRCWCARKDFKDPQLGKVIPYGVYDLKLERGLRHRSGSIPTPHSSRSQSIRRWWRHIGHRHYPDATILTITADCGGSNGNRLRLWKVELQKLADETGPADPRSATFRPARQQVEQDRASAVQLHRPQLARPASWSPAKRSSR